MEKRTLLVLLFSFLVLGFYPLLLETFYPGYFNRSHRPAPPAPPTEAIPGPELLKEGPEKASPLSASEDVSFENDRYRILFNKKGGVIREASFLKFQDQRSKKPLTFLSLEDPSAAPSFIRFLDGFGSPPDVPSDVKVGPHRVEISSVLGQTLKITKSYAFSEEHYAAELWVRFQNLTRGDLDFRYQLFVGSGLKPRHSIDSQYIEANFYSAQEQKKELRHLRETRLGRSIKSSQAVDWVALKDRHFSLILKPLSSRGFSGFVEGLGHDNLSASLLSGPRRLAPGAVWEEKFLIFLGPNTVEELLPLGLEELVNFGKLDMIGKLLIGMLELFQKLFKNYGLAIVALTVFINLLLFPLTRASFMSMKRMQGIQPHLSKIREQHKKNPEKLNKEMMELYRRHRVNPFGGCLPMLLQAPVFMALYVALSKSVILINSRFLWIGDLSSPDIVRLPLALPFIGREIHLLPLIMIAAMAVQQKLAQPKMENPDPTVASQQKMMAIMMPILFGFLFYTMPSGLVLYWLTNTILMALYQWRLTHARSV